MVLSAYFGNKLRSRLSEIKVIYETDEETIRKLNAGLSQMALSGIARRHKETTTSPIRERECLAYSSEVREQSGRVQTTVFSESMGKIFEVVDGSEKILVDPSRFRIALDKETRPVDLEAVRSILYQEGLRNIGVSDTTVNEGYIQEEDTVFLYGDLNIIDDSKFGKIVRPSTQGEAVLSNMGKKAVLSENIKRAVTQISVIILSLAASGLLLSMALGI